jgi:hypothetical protein
MEVILVSSAATVYLSTVSWPTHNAQVCLGPEDSIDQIPLLTYSLQQICSRASLASHRSLLVVGRGTKLS